MLFSKWLSSTESVRNQLNFGQFLFYLSPEQKTFVRMQEKTKVPCQFCSTKLFQDQEVGGISNFHGGKLVTSINKKK